MNPASRPTDDPIELLKVCDPVSPSALSRREVEDALDELGAALATQTARRPQLRRRRSMAGPRALLVAATVLLVIGAGIATAAGVFSAHTGRFPTKAEEAMGGPGEELDPAATDFREVALQVASDIPYPEGYVSWRDYLLSREISSMDASERELVSTGALHGWFAASGFCAWIQVWRQASLTGDTTLAGQAAATIDQAPGWDAVTDEDPHPDPSAANDPGAESGTLFGWMLPYRAAVLAGDRARVEHLLATGYGQGKCWSSDPDWMAQVAAHDEWGRLSQSELAQRYERFLASERS
jgi:hypothetical protein